MWKKLQQMRKNIEYYHILPGSITNPLQITCILCFIPTPKTAQKRWEPATHDQLWPFAEHPLQSQAFPNPRVSTHQNTRNSKCCPHGSQIPIWYPTPWTVGSSAMGLALALGLGWGWWRCWCCCGVRISRLPVWFSSEWCHFPSSRQNAMSCILAPPLHGTTSRPSDCAPIGNSLWPHLCLNGSSHLAPSCRRRWSGFHKTWPIFFPDGFIKILRIWLRLENCQLDFPSWQYYNPGSKSANTLKPWWFTRQAGFLSGPGKFSGASC